MDRYNTINRIIHGPVEAEPGPYSFIQLTDEPLDLPEILDSMKISLEMCTEAIWNRNSERETAPWLFYGNLSIHFIFSDTFFDEFQDFVGAPNVIHEISFDNADQFSEISIFKSISGSGRYLIKLDHWKKFPLCIQPIVDLESSENDSSAHISLCRKGRTECSGKTAEQDGCEFRSKDCGQFQFWVDRNRSNFIFNQKEPFSFPDCVNECIIPTMSGLDSLDIIFLLPGHEFVSFENEEPYLPRETGIAISFLSFDDLLQRDRELINENQSLKNQLEEKNRIIANLEQQMVDKTQKIEHLTSENKTLKAEIYEMINDKKDKTIGKYKNNE